MQGQTYYTNHCKKCDSLRARAWQKSNPEKYEQLQEVLKAQRKHDRKTNHALTIFRDCRHSDKRSGRTNDLTKDFVALTINRDCFYCGETLLRMSLDRVDNSKGHTMDNVIPACVRCNYIRKDMPYDAWIVVAVGMRQAREQGLFGGWGGCVFQG